MKEVKICGDEYIEVRDKKLSCKRCDLADKEGEGRYGCRVGEKDRPNCTAEFRKDGEDVIFMRIRK